MDWLHPGMIPDLILVYSLEVDSRVGGSPYIKAPELIIFSDLKKILSCSKIHVIYHLRHF